MARHIVEIETKTFIRFWLVIIGFAILTFFVIRASEALAIIGIAALLALAIRPLALKVDRLIGQKTQSRLASVLAYIIVLLVIAAIVAAIAPVIVTEFAKFLSTLPDTVKNADLSALNNIGQSFGVENLSGEIVKSIEDLSHNLLGSLGAGVISGLTTVGGIVGKAVITLVLTLFLLLDGPSLANSLWNTLGAKKSKKDMKEEKDTDVRTITEARIITRKMTNVVSTFFSRQVLIAVLDGTVTALSVFALCLIFGLETRLALPMGLITMTFYLIPMFGQVIGASLVTLILIFNNPLVAVIWLAFYIVYGFVEVNIFAPKLQGNALNLRPVIILIAMIIGTYTFGLLGAIVAIPIAGCIKVLVEEIPTIRKIRS
ncbi:AI-2E family transporter [Candidatus Saccharibacteria bacterium]|nr:AI-2E family transporter [Candidatus Saccharibacteria bacterium]